MPQILDYFLVPSYGQVSLSDQDAELSWQAIFNDQQVISDKTSIMVAIPDEEPEGQVEVEIYQGPDEKPGLQHLQRIFDGTLHLIKSGLLVFAPTGEEVLLHEVHEGSHHVAIYRDGYPTSRLVAIIDGDSQLNGSLATEDARRSVKVEGP